MSARTIAVCVAVAVVAALAAGLVANAVVDDEPGERTATDGNALGLTDQEDRPDPLAVGLLTIDGEPTTLQDHLTGKPMVVNLWAQNCAPCVKEMPLLEQAAADNPHLDVLGVDTQDDLSRAKELAAKTGITYPWIQDPTGEFFYAVGAAGMPTTLAVNPEGEILAGHAGAFESQSELQAWIERYLGPVPTSTTGATAPP